MTKFQLSALLLGLFALQACGPFLTPEGARIRTITKELGEGCEKLGRVEGWSPWQARYREPDGLTSINEVRNRAAALGGDSIVIQAKEHGTVPWIGYYRYVTRAQVLKCET